MLAELPTFMLVSAAQNCRLYGTSRTFSKRGRSVLYVFS